jgi:hypothetical protein
MAYSKPVVLAQNGKLGVYAAGRSSPGNGSCISGTCERGH